MGVELTDHNGARKERRAAQVDTRLSACRLAPSLNLSGRGIHENPTALLMAPNRIIRK